MTFNGKSFDIPLLKSRFVMNQLSSEVPHLHLDLLHVARRLHKRRIGTCSLPALEREVLRFRRGPDIAGADVAASYGHFLATGETELLHSVAQHNRWDVLSMVALVGVYGRAEEKLDHADLVFLARTLKRARALPEALAVADRAVQLCSAEDALFVRAKIAKSLGLKSQALADLEAFCASKDDPEARLELAKLYEHHLRKPRRALECVERGVLEVREDRLRRRARLLRKIDKLGG